MVLFNDFDLAETWRSICHDCKACTPKHVGSRINCKTQYVVKLGIRPLLCCDVQDKLHVAPQDKTAALRTAKTLLPMVLFSIWRDSPDMDDDIHGACRRRQLSLQVFQNQLLRPDLVPWRCRDHTTCIISVCAMTDPGCLKLMPLSEPR